MSTSDQNGTPLTRKQLRELRLTGSTPVIDETASAAAAEPAPEPEAEPTRAQEPEAQRTPEPEPTRPPAPRSPIHHIVETVKAPVSDEDDDEFVLFDTVDSAETELPPISPIPVTEAPVSAPKPSEPEPAAAADAAPAHAPMTRREMRRQERSRLSPAPVQGANEDDREAIKSIFEASVADDEPAPAAAETPRVGTAEPAPAAIVPKPMPAPVAPRPAEPEPEREPEPEPEPESERESEATSQTREESRPMVGAAFGIGVKAKAGTGHGLPTAFDELLEHDSAGATQTSSTLIFTPAPGVGSLSGPIASTGELLITGSYKLPEGLGSRGHASGTTDGKEVDAVLIDGELAPTSSPTPIAASSAISTLKPAGEVIRPPAPDKSSKLTLTLAIVAGGLGLALAVVIGVAAVTGVFS